MKEEHVSLYYKEGGSDKVYLARLEPDAKGWSVPFSFGRRGNALSNGCKIHQGTYEEAKKVYDKLVSEKTGKGYKVEGGGVISTPAASQAVNFTARDTGIRVQLLNYTDEARVEELMTDDAWCMQEKFNGRRRAVLITPETGLIGTNRKGQTVTLSGDIAGVKHPESICAVLDSEDMGSYLRVFDMLEDDMVDLRGFNYQMRLSHLNKYLDDVGPEMKLIETAYTEKEKRALYAKVKKADGEGVVFKRLDAKYSAGKPNSGGDMLKFPFKAIGDFIVDGKLRPGKRSVPLAVYAAPDLTIGVGYVTVPPNKTMPALGAIVEIKYLYAFPGGSLFQPIYLGERDDLEAKDCTVKQLKYKPEEEEV